MINNIFFYSGSAIIFFWGIGHLFPTKEIIKGFGDISEDNKKIITMEWISEGFTLCFIGLLAFLTTLFRTTDSDLSYVIYLSLTAMLLILAALSLRTGAKTSIVPMKICPSIKIIAASLLIIGVSI